jgi:hypothetical protein
MSMADGSGLSRAVAWAKAPSLLGLPRGVWAAAAVAGVVMAVRAASSKG